MPAASHGSAIILTPRRAAHSSRRAIERPVPAEHRGEVEAEAVDAEVGVAVERHEDDVLGCRRGGVDVVTAPCRLDVRTVGVEAVVVAVGEAPEAVRRPAGVDLGRVVVDDVDPHLEVAVVGRGDELAQLAGGVVAGGVLPVHGTEGQRHVAPVAALLGVVLVHREQFEDAETEGGDAVEVADQGAVRARRRSRRLGDRHAADVRFVDDRGATRSPLRPRRRPRSSPGERRLTGVRRRPRRWRLGGRAPAETPPRSPTGRGAPWTGRTGHRRRRRPGRTPFRRRSRRPNDRRHDPADGDSARRCRHR